MGRGSLFGGGWGAVSLCCILCCSCSTFYDLKPNATNCFCWYMLNTTPMIQSLFGISPNTYMYNQYGQGQYDQTIQYSLYNLDKTADYCWYCRLRYQKLLIPIYTEIQTVAAIQQSNFLCKKFCFHTRLMFDTSMRMIYNCYWFRGLKSLE